MKLHAKQGASRSWLNKPVNVFIKAIFRLENILIGAGILFFFLGDRLLGVAVIVIAVDTYLRFSRFRHRYVVITKAIFRVENVLIGLGILFFVYLGNAFGIADALILIVAGVMLYVLLSRFAEINKMLESWSVTTEDIRDMLDTTIRNTVADSPVTQHFHEDRNEGDLEHNDKDNNEISFSVRGNTDYNSYDLDFDRSTRRMTQKFTGDCWAKTGFMSATPVRELLSSG